MKSRTCETVSARKVVCGYDRSIPRMMFTLAVLVVMFSGSECHGRTHMPLSFKSGSLTLSDFVGGIIVRSKNLNYVTEQDSEVFVFYRNTAVKDMTDSVFLALLRRPAETEIIQQSWSIFFQLRTANDPTGRWRTLQKYLEPNLTNLTIFRLPRGAPYGAQYDLYAVGIFNGDTVVGVQMFGVAT